MSQQQFGNSTIQQILYFTLTESIITISLVGLIVGFIFSMPVAGPISILVTSNALKQRLKYCNLVTLGASLADFVYVFAAVFGLTNFYSIYKPLIPYILLLGTLFLLFLGYRISKTQLDLEHLEDKNVLSQKIRRQERGGFLTGFMLSFFNPTLFLNWLTSSFIVISLVSSLGFNTGGLDKSVSESFKAIHKTDGGSIAKNKALAYLHLDSVKLVKRGMTDEELAQLPEYSPLLLSLSYAFFVSLGSVIWFFYLAYLLSKHRDRINIKYVNRIIQFLGILLCIFGLFLGYKAIIILTSN